MMPDHPYVEPSPAPSPVRPGGARVRLFRRHRQPGEEAREDSPDRGGTANDAAWEGVLHQAVWELNAWFSRSELPFTCTLQKEEDCLCLSVQRNDGKGEPAVVEEEVLAPGDLPRWLSRLRLHLGLVVDETA